MIPASAARPEIPEKFSSPSQVAASAETAAKNTGAAWAVSLHQPLFRLSIHTYRFLRSSSAPMTEP